MKFRNYCIVVMGETNGVVSEIIKVSEIEPNVLDAKGILIATFSSVAEPKELNDYFIENNRSFLLFDLNKNASGFNIIKKEIHDGLFGFLKNMDESKLKEKTDSLIKEISSTTVTDKVIKLKKKKNVTPAKTSIKLNIAIEDIDKLSTKEKNELINKFIDNGIENLTEFDKNILNKLSS